MTSRSYFEKMNSTLGSVVPLAMFKTITTQAIPTSEEICPLIIWILVSMGFISFALFEYFALLILVRYDKEVSLFFLSFLLFSTSTFR